MATLERVTQQFFNGRSHGDGPQSADLLEPGLISVDYGDDDYVFLVHVTKVARQVKRYDTPLELLDTNDLSVRLTQIETSNYVTVILDVVARADREAGPYAIGLSLLLHDDAGTTFGLHSAEDGGSDHPNRVVRRFRPLPPRTATTLTATVRILGQEPSPSGAVTVELPLADEPVEPSI